MTSIDTTDAVELDALTPMIELYREAQTRIKEWQDIAAQARAQLEARLGDHDTGTVAGCPAVRWSHVKSNRLDQTLVKSLHPDVYAECQTVTTSRRFVLVDGD